MAFTELLPCDKCGRSPWVHVLRGPVLYCDHSGGRPSSYTAEQVGAVRAAIGKPDLINKQLSFGT